jgi:hypothetical protein
VKPTGKKSPRKQITFRKDEVQKELTSYGINSFDSNLHKIPSSSSELEAPERRISAGDSPFDDRPAGLFESFFQMLIVTSVSE